MQESYLGIRSISRVSPPLESGGFLWVISCTRSHFTLLLPTFDILVPQPNPSEFFSSNNSKYVANKPSNFFLIFSFLSILFFFVKFPHIFSFLIHYVKSGARKFSWFPLPQKFRNFTIYILYYLHAPSTSFLKFLQFK